jgi:hypothetical protein
MGTARIALSHEMYRPDYGGSGELENNGSGSIEKIFG